MLGQTGGVQILAWTHVDKDADQCLHFGVPMQTDDDLDVDSRTCRWRRKHSPCLKQPCMKQRLDL